LDWFIRRDLCTNWYVSQWHCIRYKEIQDFWIIEVQKYTSHIEFFYNISYFLIHYLYTKSKMIYEKLWYIILLFYFFQSWLKLNYIFKHWHYFSTFMYIITDNGKFTHIWYNNGDKVLGADNCLMFIHRSEEYNIFKQYINYLYKDQAVWGNLDTS